ncbi:uncharacterized protein [Salmo salar]|uniref:Uncharacterized protein LOC106573800 n=1 Tax=Salmo salar TaxID=8030 RepID=A0A1S3MP67_SALSA|nr:uncharacterized protein LOC106573800 [Salmo salar]XP_045553159.1 uncharacterized protein LOC106573800 [Salmo salar]|eukprot:XP_014004623.1 PREDICTED: uncharacterized protein LOC106573800 [Salmo salar]
MTVDFHELLGSSDAPELVPQVDNTDILCSVVALFDVSLPVVGPRDVHDTVHSHGTHTIILLRQQSDVLVEYRSRTPPSFRGEPVSSPVPAVVNGHRESEGRYLQVFSESEDSSDSSDDHEEVKECTEPRSASAWETFCMGLEEFLARARERRAQREAPGDEQQILPTAVGAESLIVGAAAYKLKTLSTGEKVLQLSLMATRKRYGNCGGGHHIIELLKTQSVCGAYDAFLSHADTDARGGLLLMLWPH